MPSVLFLEDFFEDHHIESRYLCELHGVQKIVLEEERAVFNVLSLKPSAKFLQVSLQDIKKNYSIGILKSFSMKVSLIKCLQRKCFRRLNHCLLSGLEILFFKGGMFNDIIHLQQPEQNR